MVLREDCVNILSALSIEKAHILGTSMGAVSYTHLTLPTKA